MPVVVGRFCPSCGAPRTREGPFCERCGAAVAPPVAAPRPSVAAAAARRRGPPWGRLLVGLVVLALVVLGIAVASPDPGAERLGLGAATAKDPDPARIVASAEWGLAPADQVVVLLADGRGRADAERAASALDARIVGEVAFLGLYQLETSARSAAQLDAAIAAARGIEGVAVAAANQAVASKDTAGTRCDPLADPSYLKGANAKAYELIGLRAAWDVIAGAGVALKAVKIGVLDDALYTPTGEFDGAVKATGDKTSTIFKNAFGALEIGGIGHGTAVAHMLAADPNDGGPAGVAGVLGDKVELMVRNIYRAGPRYAAATPDPKDPTQVVFQGQTFVYQTFVDIVQQIDGGATVVNASFGPEEPDPKHKAAAQMWRAFLTKMAREHPKVLFVAAAGNEKGALDGLNYSIGGHPLPNLITVGSVDPSGARSSFSNYAQGGDGEVTLAAPGSNVMVGVGADGQPIISSGTSFATPQVSGAAALLRSLDPDLTAAQIKDILAATASPGVPAKNAQGNDISAPVAKEIGGRILRVDQAVLRVVNDLRRKADAKAAPLTMDALRALAAIDVKGVQKDALAWTVVADLPAVTAGGTEVRIEFSGQASVGGLSTQKLTSAGSAQWPLTFLTPTDSAYVTVRRMDSNACARVALKAGGVVPSPTPAAAGAAPGLRALMEEALRASGHATYTVVRPGEDAPAGPHLLCYEGGAEPQCQYLESANWDKRDVRATGLQLSAYVRQTAVSAQAKFTGEQSGAPAAFAQGTYRGLRSAVRLEQTDPIVLNNRRVTGYPDQWSARRDRVVLIGNIVLHEYRSAQCNSSESSKQSCGITPAAPPDAWPELDALIDAIVKAGLVPAGTVR